MLVPKRMGAREKESTGGSPAFAARVSTGETPAKWQKVALSAAAMVQRHSKPKRAGAAAHYQSQPAISPSNLVPRTGCGRKPPDTKALTLCQQQQP